MNAAAKQTVNVVPARYEGWTISGRIDAGRGVIALPVFFGSSDPARPLAEGARQWRGILNGF